MKSLIFSIICCLSFCYVGLSQNAPVTISVEKENYTIVGDWELTFGDDMSFKEYARFNADGTTEELKYDETNGISIEKMDEDATWKIVGESLFLSVSTEPDNRTTEIDPVETIQFIIHWLNKDQFTLSMVMEDESVLDDPEVSIKFHRMLDAKNE